MDRVVAPGLWRWGRAWSERCGPLGQPRWSSWRRSARRAALTVAFLLGAGPHILGDVTAALTILTAVFDDGRSRREDPDIVAHRRAALGRRGQETAKG